MTAEEMVVFIKPDGYIRRYVGTRALKTILNIGASVEYFGEERPSKDFMSQKHYVHLKGKFFFDWLVDMTTSAPILFMLLKGDAVTSKVRGVLGATISETAEPLSIRGRYGIGGINIAHASDSPENAANEVKMWRPTLKIEPRKNYRDKAIEYIKRYENFPMVDNIRYREIGTELSQGAITEAMASSLFQELLRKESDADNTTLSRFSTLLVENFTMRK